jgi:hypothetical protein
LCRIPRPRSETEHRLAIPGQPKGHLLPCSVSNAYGTGSSREKRQASNDARTSKVEKVLCPTISEFFLSTILFF